MREETHFYGENKFLKIVHEEEESCSNCRYEYECDWKPAKGRIRCEEWRSEVYKPNACIMISEFVVSGKAKNITAEKVMDAIQDFHLPKKLDKTHKCITITVYEKKYNPSNDYTVTQAVCEALNRLNMLDVDARGLLILTDHVCKWNMKERISVRFSGL